MNNKIQKYREELEKIEAKMTVLKERGKALELKIKEAETLEICALMQSENLTMNELIALARSRKDGQGPSFIADRQADGDQEKPGDDEAAPKRKDYTEEDEDDEDYE
jgi:hypothetical protein